MDALKGELQERQDEAQDMLSKEGSELLGPVMDTPGLAMIAKTNPELALKLYKAYEAAKPLILPVAIGLVVSTIVLAGTLYMGKKTKEEIQK